MKMKIEIMTYKKFKVYYKAIYENQLAPMFSIYYFMSR